MFSILLLPAVNSSLWHLLVGKCMGDTVGLILLLQVNLYLQKLCFMGSEWVEGIYWRLN